MIHDMEKCEDNVKPMSVELPGARKSGQTRQDRHGSDVEAWDILGFPPCFRHVRAV
jgi:hypothetical protein